MKLSIALLLISAAKGFVVPGEMNVVVDKLVNVLPPIGETDPLELAAKTAIVPFILYAPFSTQSAVPEHILAPEGEVDYDAPIERQLKVGHIVRRQPYTLGLGSMGTVTPPNFIQQALGLFEPENKFVLPDIDEQYYTLVHDECYLGKDCTARECVDFDPLH